MDQQAQHDAYYAITDMIGTSRLCMAVGLGIAIWDWLSTLNLEYQHVWRSQKLLSLMNIAFLVNRYMCLFTLSFFLWLFYLPDSKSDLCQRVFRTQPYLPMVVYMAASTIVVVRVYAVWDKSRVVLGVLCGLLLVQIVCQGWAPHQAVAAQLPPGIHACVPKDDNPRAWVYFGSMLLFDTATLCLMLFRTLKIYRHSGISAVTFVLVRDQILFYGLTFTAGLANIIHFARKGEYHNPALLTPFTISLVSISANRILLNLRSISTEGQSSVHSGISKIRRTQHFGQYPNSAPTTPLSPVHHPRYPERAAGRDTEKESEYELEKMPV